ncbi:hypothetical protein SAMN05216436_1163 [bacterium A37T11]|nr:hypothetical protein SAMN05216436_1163 [bacterium A37T11]
MVLLSVFKIDTIFMKQKEWIPPAFSNMLIAVMEEYPDVSYVEHNEGIIIYSNYEHGFDIIIVQVSYDRFIVSFGLWCTETQDPYEAIRLLKLALAESSRLEVDVRKADKLIWKFQYLVDGAYQSSPALESFRLEPEHTPEDPNFYYLQNIPV